MKAELWSETALQVVISSNATDIQPTFSLPSSSLASHHHHVQSDTRLTWITTVSRLAETGLAQTLIVLISLLWTASRLLDLPHSGIKVPSVLHSPHRASAIRWNWEVIAQTSRALTLCLLALAAAEGQTSWLNVGCLAYAFIFGLLRVAYPALAWRHIALHQVNFILSTTLFLLTSSKILPCVEAHQPCVVSGSMRMSMASLAFSVVMALITPREWLPPSWNPAQIPSHPKLAAPPKAALSPAPEEACSWANYYLTYDWLNYLIWKGTWAPVTLEDLPRLAWYDDPSLLLCEIQRARAKSGSTFLTVLRLLRREACTMTCYIAASYVLELVAPFALYQLLAYLADPEGSAIRPWVWLLLMFCGPLSRSVCYQQYIFTATRVIVRVKSAMTQELYHRAMASKELDDSVFALGAPPSTPGKKSKSRHRASPSVSSAGYLANLMSADVEAIHGSRDIIKMCVGVPIGTFVSLVGLYKMLGWPSLVGAAMFLLVTPLSVFIAQVMAKATRTSRRAQDSRISLISEYLASIRPLKYLAWEDAAASRIQAARDTEQKHTWRVSVLFVYLNQVSNLIPFAALLVMLSLYVTVSKVPLTAATAFTTVYLVKNIRRNVSQLGFLSKRITAGMVALNRLDRYFANTVPIEKHCEGPLSLRSATFRRSRQASFELKGISVDFVDGGLNVISGRSGSGKTTLLLGILGEAERLAGRVTRPRDVAFASQTPWLQNDTIRENILFHSPYEQVRYDMVIDACCLSLDLGQLALGDQTIIGENGASLSGGQRARLALARALYSKAPLILLDDVFSALDSRTSALLWQRCFCADMLDGRTTVLVAQQPWIARQADLIIRLDSGALVSLQPNLGVVRRPVVASEEVNSDAWERRSDSLDDTETESPPGGSQILESVADSGSSELVNQEMKASKGSTRLMAFHYMSYFGSAFHVALCLMSIVFTNMAWLSSSLWLSVWVEAYSKVEAVKVGFFLGIFIVLTVLESLTYAVAILAFEKGAWLAARKLHSDFTSAVMRVSLSWYNVVPVGRVINRFSRDMMSLDSKVSPALRNSCDTVVTLFFRIGAISSVLPIFTIPAAMSCFLGIAVGEMYTRTAVTVKRLVSSAQSPVFAQFSDTLAGLAVIRARQGMPAAFGDTLAESLRVWSRAAEANYNCNRWVAMRVDVITALVGLCAGIIAVSKAGVVAAGLVGFSLINATDLNQTILGLVRSMNDLEVELQSFLRVREYASLEPEEKSNETYTEEGQYADDESHVVPMKWPTTGKIEFRNVTIRYEPDGPDILTNVSLVFNAGERVAIVGRTGSGKSTLVLSILRFTHIVSGEILYDGIDITKVSRKRLREALTIIPQEAVLFSGTVESNLDPTGTVSREVLEGILNSCRGIASFKQSANGDASLAGHNGDRPSSKSITLDTTISTNGENFSHGQRQVLSLCRALVRQSRLMLLDEATASMDYETDKGIQEVLRGELSHSDGARSLVTIAHRLRTIIDYDTVVVMSSGRVAEAGKPRELFANGGLFYDMVLHSGEGQELRETLAKGEVYE